jgi:hypothetical protein
MGDFWTSAKNLPSSWKAENLHIYGEQRTWKSDAQISPVPFSEVAQSWFKFDPQFMFKNVKFYQSFCF